MSKKNANIIKIGIVVGGGTGKELSEIFKKVILSIKPTSQKIEFIECPHIFNTYESLKNLDDYKVKEINKKEFNILKSFYKDFYKIGGRVIFRTAINAESLYLLRRWGKCIKLFTISFDNCNILFCRDQMQGFYSNDNYLIKKNKVQFSASFSKNDLKEVIDFSLQEARKVFGRDFEILCVYKHHLFSNIIENWIKEILPGKILSKIKICQPSPMIQFLFELDKKKKYNILIIMGNEIGDICHELFLYQFTNEKSKTSFSQNIYLNKEIKGLIEYQTVHGSADDIAGKDIVNPIATLKIAGKIGEDVLRVKNFYTLMEKVIKNHYDKIQSRYKTSEFVDQVIKDISRMIRKA
ncbi:MAG: isocitrate/isopropylmalate family dehydrogenase [candidate division WOR-3 bacterium]